MAIWCSCNTNNYMPGFDFKLFKNTPVWELAKAVEKEDTSRITMILKDRSIKVDYHDPKLGNTLLMLAVTNHKKKSIIKLLEAGANPNERDYSDNATPLLYACEYHTDDCDTSILNMLIKRQADVNFIQNIDRIEDNGAHSIVKATVLMIAVESGCLNMVKVLLNSGADINRYTYNDGYGAITVGLIQDNLQIVKYLIIDKQARIPAYCFIRNEGEKDEQRLTITDMLNEQHYDSSSDNFKYKEEIIGYLKSKSLK